MNQTIFFVVLVSLVLKTFGELSVDWSSRGSKYNKSSFFEIIENLKKITFDDDPSPFNCKL